MTKIEIISNDFVKSSEEWKKNILDGNVSYKINDDNIYDIYKPNGYIRLKFYGEVTYDNLYEIKMNIPNYIERCDIIIEKEYNGEYSVVMIKPAAPVKVLKYGIYQPCIEKYFDYKDKKLNSWSKEAQSKLIIDSLRYKEIHNNNIYIK